MNNKTRAEYIAEWKSSGLSKTEYCKEHGIQYGTFQSWIRKVKSEKVEWQPISIAEEREELRNFFELRVEENWKIEINLRFRI